MRWSQLSFLADLQSIHDMTIGYRSFSSLLLLHEHKTQYNAIGSRALSC